MLLSKHTKHSRVSSRGLLGEGESKSLPSCEDMSEAGRLTNRQTSETRGRGEREATEARERAVPGGHFYRVHMSHS